MISTLVFLVIVVLDVQGHGVFTPAIEDDDDSAASTMVYTPGRDHFLDQKLDHFNTMDLRFWKQRYFHNDTFYKSGGPVFLYIGPESPLPEPYAYKGAWFEYAQTYSAMVFALEHRYYGQSHPTPNLSNANLRFMSVAQALEDLAYFIIKMNELHRFSSPLWITFGGSYGGMMSAYMRYKFPHLVTGAVAHSAPMSLPMLVTGYGGAVKTVLDDNPGCNAAVKASFDAVRALLKTDAGTTRLKTLFKICPFDRHNKMDVENLLFSLIVPVMGTVQYKNCNFAYMTPIQLPTVTQMCQVLGDTSRGDAVQRLANLSNIVNGNYTTNLMNGSCQEVRFSSMISAGQNPDFDKNIHTLSGRQWNYLACTQFAGFIVFDNDNPPFGRILSENYYLNLCKGYFGSSFNLTMVQRAYENFKMDYGGAHIQATNVIYTVGLADPTHLYGFMKPPNPKTNVVIIPDVGHEADMFASSPSDSHALTQARLKIQRILGRWLSGLHTSIFIG